MWDREGWMVVGGDGEGGMRDEGIAAGTARCVPPAISPRTRGPGCRVHAEVEGVPPTPQERPPKRTGQTMPAPVRPHPPTAGRMIHCCGAVSEDMGGEKGEAAGEGGDGARWCRPRRSQEVMVASCELT